MHAATFGGIEMEMLWLSAALGLLTIALTAAFLLFEGRLRWGLGPRDTAGPPAGRIGGRLERVLRNYLETFAIFAALVLMAQVLGRHSTTSALGAQLYFWARLAYVPVYAAGIPVLRTAVWAVSAVGIVLVLLAVFPGT